MPADCRQITDDLNDPQARAGDLIVGSDAVDLSGASMTAGPAGWKVLLKTSGPAIQNPRLKTTVALYLDADGRSGNNAQAGPRQGADTVYAILHEDGGWRITKEVLDAKQNAFLIEPTQATYSIGDAGYTLEIPYAEVPAGAPAYWRVGAASEEKMRLTFDYAPDAGLSCAPGLGGYGPRPLLDAGNLAMAVAGAIVIAAAMMIIWKRIGKKHDHQKPTH